MSHLPQISGKECVKVLEKFDFIVRRQTGSNIIMRKSEPFCQIVVPNHKTLDKGTLRAILRQAEITVEQFIDYF